MTSTFENSLFTALWSDNLELILYEVAGQRSFVWNFIYLEFHWVDEYDTIMDSIVGLN